MPETSEPTDLTALVGGIRAADLTLSKEAADALKADAISLRAMAHHLGPVGQRNGEEGTDECQWTPDA